MEQLFLDKPGQCPDGIAQAAEGAGVPAEKPVEQQREAAQPQQGKREAVRREHLARTDVHKELLFTPENPATNAPGMDTKKNSCTPVRSHARRFLSR